MGTERPHRDFVVLEHVADQFAVVHHGTSERVFLEGEHRLHFSADDCAYLEDAAGRSFWADSIFNLSLHVDMGKDGDQPREYLRDKRDSSVRWKDIFVNDVVEGALCLGPEVTLAVYRYKFAVRASERSWFRVWWPLPPVENFLVPEGHDAKWTQRNFATWSKQLGTLAGEGHLRASFKRAVAAAKRDGERLRPTDLVSCPKECTVTSPGLIAILCFFGSKCKSMTAEQRKRSWVLMDKLLSAFFRDRRSSVEVVGGTWRVACSFSGALVENIEAEGSKAPSLQDELENCRSEAGVLSMADVFAHLGATVLAGRKGRACVLRDIATELLREMMALVGSRLEMAVEDSTVWASTDLLNLPVLKCRKGQRARRLGVQFKRRVVETVAQTSEIQRAKQLVACSKILEKGKTTSMGNLGRTTANWFNEDSMDQYRAAQIQTYFHSTNICIATDGLRLGGYEVQNIALFDPDSGIASWGCPQVLLSTIMNQKG